jgi:hypothetical protein
LKNDMLKDLYSGQIKTIVPSFPITDVFQAQFQGIFFNDYKENQKRIDTCMQPLIADILPPEFLKKQKKESGLLKGLFNKKITIEKKESKGADILK